MPYEERRSAEGARFPEKRARFSAAYGVFAPAVCLGSKLHTDGRAPPRPGARQFRSWGSNFPPDPDDIHTGRPSGASGRRTRQRRSELGPESVPRGNKLGGGPAKSHTNGRHVARVTDDETYFYLTDHLGTTVAMTDESGEVVWTGEGTPFGDKVDESGELADSEELKYTGKDRDPATGLYYFNARWYDAELGRFVTEDPARDGGEWYLYANASPVLFTDPSGKIAIIDDVIGWALGRLAGQRDDGFLEGVTQNFTESWKLVWGTINTFENNTTAGDFLLDVGELVLRFTWNLPNEALGLILGYWSIQVRAGVTERFADVQLLITPQDSAIAAAYSIGSKVIGGESFLNHPKPRIREWARRHEQGHYYQQLITGPSYLPLVGVPVFWAACRGVPHRGRHTRRTITDTRRRGQTKSRVLISRPGRVDVRFIYSPVRPVPERKEDLDGRTCASFRKA